MAKIIGGTTSTPMRNPDWNQTNPARADYIKNKPDVPNALKGNVSGGAVGMPDVSPFEHELKVRVIGDAVDGTTITQYGKNLLDFAEWHLTGAKQVDVVDGVYKMLANASFSTMTILSDTQLKECYVGVSTFPAGTYIFSAEQIKNHNLCLDIVLADGTSDQIVAGTPKKVTQPFTLYKIMIYGSQITMNTGETFTTTFQLEASDTATPYEPFNLITTATVNADGSVNGLVSYYPCTTLLTDTDGAIIECEYNKDLNKAYDALVQAIISLGGNV